MDHSHTELHLLFSAWFDKNDAEAVRAALGEHLAVGAPEEQFQKSADPSLNVFIQLLGEAECWLPLVVPATFFFKSYLSTLGKHAADATRDGLRQVFKNKEVKPLADVSTILVNIANKVDGEIIVGLDIPDDFSGTAIRIKTQKPEEMAYQLSAFIVHVEALSNRMKAEVAAGHVPRSGVVVVVQVQDDGSLLVKWHNQINNKDYEIRIP